MESCHCWYGTNGSWILKRGYQAAKFTRMTSSEVIGSNSENTSSQSLLSYVPKDLHSSFRSCWGDRWQLTRLAMLQDLTRLRSSEPMCTTKAGGPFISFILY